MAIKNFVRVELSSSISSTDTSITFIDSVSPFENPPSDGALVLTDNEWNPTKFEVVTYTGVTDNGDGTYTATGVARGQEGSTAQAWASGTIITQTPTSGTSMLTDGSNASAAVAFPGSLDVATDVYAQKAKLMSNGTYGGSLYMYDAYDNLIYVADVTSSGDFRIRNVDINNDSRLVITKNTGQVQVNNTLFANYASNVGIGTPSPTDKLDVNGITKIRNGSTYGQLKLHRESNNIGVSYTIGQLKFSSLKDNVETVGATVDSFAAGVWGGTNSSAYLRFQTTDANGALSEIVRFAHDGKVGIGTTSPTRKLTVVGDAEFRREDALSDYQLTHIYSNATANFIDFKSYATYPKPVVFDQINSGAGTYYGFRFDGTTKLIIKQNGNVGIGKIAPETPLDVEGDVSVTNLITTASLKLYRLTNNPASSIGCGKVEFGALQDNVKKPSADITGVTRGDWNSSNQSMALWFRTVKDNDALSTRMVINHDGNVGIGTTAPSYTLHVAGDIYATGNITSASDIRYKVGLKTIDGALDKIGTLNGFTYSKKHDESEEPQRYAGVSAQAVRKVLPEVVMEDSDGNLSVAYGQMNALLIEGIKELKTIIKKQQTKITALQMRVKALEEG